MLLITNKMIFAILFFLFFGISNYYMKEKFLFFRIKTQCIIIALLIVFSVIFYVVSVV